MQCHLLYGLTVWGGANKVKLLILEKTLGKIWRKFGIHYKHTSEHLISNKLLKFEDELRTQVRKLLWKWNNKKIPKSLTNIVKEKQD